MIQKTKDARSVRFERFVSWIIKIKYILFIRGMAINKEPVPDTDDIWEGKFIYRWQKLPKDYEWL